MLKLSFRRDDEVIPTTGEFLVASSKRNPHAPLDEVHVFEAPDLPPIMRNRELLIPPTPAGTLEHDQNKHRHIAEDGHRPGRHDDLKVKAIADGPDINAEPELLPRSKKWFVQTC